MSGIGAQYALGSREYEIKPHNYVGKLAVDANQGRPLNAASN